MPRRGAASVARRKRLKEAKRKGRPVAALSAKKERRKRSDDN